MDVNTTVVTAGDANFAWGTFLLVASMRMNGMKQPVLVGAMGWSDEMKHRVEALGGVTIKDLPLSRQCVTCQKPLLMMDDAIDTEWVWRATKLKRRLFKSVKGETRLGDSGAILQVVAVSAGRGDDRILPDAVDVEWLVQRHHALRKIERPRRELTVFAAQARHASEIVFIQKGSAAYGELKHRAGVALV